MITNIRRIPKKHVVPKKTPKRQPIPFSNLVKRIADTFGRQAAVAWTKAVSGYRLQINQHELESAIVSKNLKSIEAAIAPAKLQTKIAKAIEPTFLKTAQVAGTESAKILSAKGIDATFNAVHPNVVLFARQQAAQLVVDVPRQTKQVIAEVVARGAERGITVVQQAKAIKELIGLPPNWIDAPAALAEDLSNGRIAAATGRKISGVLRRQIVSAAKKGTIDAAFIQKAVASYTDSLITARALTIARTETQRAAHAGLIESWDQAQAEGNLPSTTKQFWLITEDERLCPICVRIPGMNPAGRALGESFMTPEGLVDYPPAPHPNCRCSIGLGFGV